MPSIDGQNRSIHLDEAIKQTYSCVRCNNKWGVLDSTGRRRLDPKGMPTPEGEGRRCPNCGADQPAPQVVD